MKNTIELLGHYGSDITHAQSAWTSTIRELNNEKIQRIPKLLKMLADQGHHTIFEKSSLHFLVDCDIASHIHILKHRVGVSVNGESARYKELKEDKYYLPEDWKNVPDAKLAAMQYVETSWAKNLKEYTEKGNELYHRCIKDLEPVLGRKRAKESARFFKTYNSRIQSDVMFNWRSFAHFLALRNKPDAQLEIREIAADMLRLVKEIPGNPYEHTIAAFDL